MMSVWMSCLFSNMHTLAKIFCFIRRMSSMFLRKNVKIDIPCKEKGTTLNNIGTLFVWTESWSIWGVWDLSWCHSDERPHLPTTKWTLPLAEPLPTVLRFVRGRSMFHSWWEIWDFIFCVEDKTKDKCVLRVWTQFQYSLKLLNFTGLMKCTN